jgi:adenine-specific DNA glycosylase
VDKAKRAARLPKRVQAFAEAQATAVLAVVKGRKDTVIAGNVLRVVKKRVHANKRRLSRK